MIEIHESRRVQRNHGHPAHVWLRKELLQVTAVQRRSTSFIR